MSSGFWPGPSPLPQSARPFGGGIKAAACLHNGYRSKGPPPHTRPASRAAASFDVGLGTRERERERERRTRTKEREGNRAAGHIGRLDGRTNFHPSSSSSPVPPPLRPFSVSLPRCTCFQSLQTDGCTNAEEYGSSRLEELGKMGKIRI